jgi:hypothetical protein
MTHTQKLTYERYNSTAKYTSIKDSKDTSIGGLSPKPSFNFTSIL